MLLKALHDFAHRRDLLKDLAFAEKPVRWIIELDEKGSLLGIVRTGDDKAAKEFRCPETTRPKNGAGVSEFLADGLTAVFGLATGKDEESSEAKRQTQEANNRAKRADFWCQIRRAMRETKSQHRLAMLRCWRLTRSRKNLPAFLRWGLATAPKPNEKDAWWMTTASGTEAKLGNDFFSFRVGTELMLEADDLIAWWRKTHALEQTDLRAESELGVCLITAAENVPLARNHKPLISGVPGAGGMGTIVSFESSSFTSYGLEKSLNAPTSIDASQAYAVALNELLMRRDHCIKTGPACIVFWAQKTVKASGFFATLLQEPKPATVRGFLRSPWTGISDTAVPDNDDFFAVTLTGNKGRIVVKHWLQCPLEAAVKNLKTWFEDLDLVVPPRSETEYNPLSIYWLSRATLSDQAAKKLEKKLPPNVPAQLYRAALEGTAPPIALLKPLLDQLHSKIVKDENYRVIWDESRFALLKLIINRHHRTRNELNMELAPQLAETSDPAYNCGRLLSVFDALQRAAHRAEAGGGSKLNTTLAERYFGAASSNPNGAFSLMWRLHMHHLKKLRQKGEKGQRAAAGCQRSIMAICRHFTAPKPASSPQFPRVFTLVQQGRFALGYYQQEAHRAEQVRLWKERQAAAGKADETDAEEPDLEILLTEESQS